MAISLNNLRSAKGSRTSKKRVGRGLGSTGTTAGRGQKGQTSRSGVGGLRRLGMRHTLLATPKLRGFNSLQNKPQVVNLEDLQGKFIAGEVVTPRTLSKKGLILNPKAQVKILSQGEVSVALTVKNCLVSAGAKDKITAAGGKIEA